jgi:LysM repeat protein
MIIPNYADIGGPAQQNGNRHYKIFVGPDSAGNPGIWHVYYDGAKEFLVSPAAAPPAVDITAWGQPNPAFAAAPAAPASDQSNGNGGTQAPDTAAPAPASVGAWGGAAPNSMSTNIDAYQAANAAPEPSAPAATDSRPAKPNSDFNWQFNEEKNAWYYDQLHQASDGSSGFIHHYADGSTFYVAKTPPTHSALGIDSSDAMGGGGAGMNSMQTSLAANEPQQTNAQAAADGHDTTTVVETASAVGLVNNADGLHNGTGFSGHASELHSPAPDAAAPAPEVIAAVQAIAPDTHTDTASATPVVSVAPEAASLSPAADASHLYTVVPGDNMWDIAQRNHMSLQDLEALNPQIEHPELILPGQQINLGNGEAVIPPSDPGTAFPTTSSYDSTSTQPQTAEAHKVSMSGWSDGTGSVPHDPTHGIAAVAQVQTDPLKIHDDKASAA